MGSSQEMGAFASGRSTSTDESEVLPPFRWDCFVPVMQPHLAEIGFISSYSGRFERFDAEEFAAAHHANLSSDAERARLFAAGALEQQAEQTGPLRSLALHAALVIRGLGSFELKDGTLSESAVLLLKATLLLVKNRSRPASELNRRAVAAMQAVALSPDAAECHRTARDFEEALTFGEHDGVALMADAETLFTRQSVPDRSPYAVHLDLATQAAIAHARAGEGFHYFTDSEVTAVIRTITRYRKRFETGALLHAATRHLTGRAAQARYLPMQPFAAAVQLAEDLVPGQALCAWLAALHAHAQHLEKTPELLHLHKTLFRIQGSTQQNLLESAVTARGYSSDSCESFVELPSSPRHSQLPSDTDSDDVPNQLQALMDAEKCENTRKGRQQFRRYFEALVNDGDRAAVQVLALMRASRFGLRSSTP